MLCETVCATGTLPNACFMRAPGRETYAHCWGWPSLVGNPSNVETGAAEQSSPTPANPGCRPLTHPRLSLRECDHSDSLRHTDTHPHMDTRAYTWTRGDREFKTVSKRGGGPLAIRTTFENMFSKSLASLGVFIPCPPRRNRRPSLRWSRRDMCVCAFVGGCPMLAVLRGSYRKPPLGGVP